MFMLYFHVFCDSMFSLELFSKFDIDMLQMFFTHEDTLILGYICNICGKMFKITQYMKKHQQKSTYIILVPSQIYQDF